MPKLSEVFKNEVLSHAEELVNRYKKIMKEILKEIEQDRKKGRTIRPTDKQIHKFWPLEMLLAKYGAIVLRDDFTVEVSRVLEIRKKQRLQARKHALRYLYENTHHQRKEKMKQEWQSRR